MDLSRECWNAGEKAQAQISMIETWIKGFKSSCHIGDIDESLPINEQIRLIFNYSMEEAGCGTEKLLHSPNCLFSQQECICDVENGGIWKKEI